MNVYIRKRDTKEIVVRYEVHLAGKGTIPPDERYFDEAWRRATEDRLVDAGREAYEFQLQRPKNLYESSV